MQRDINPPEIQCSVSAYLPLAEVFMLQLMHAEIACQLAKFCRVSLSKTRLPRPPQLQRHRVCKPASSAVLAPARPAQKMSSPAMSQIEQRLAAQHEQQADMLPIQRDGSQLILHGDTVLLDNLHPSVQTSQHNSGGTVLGVEVYNGAVAFQDFPLGKVHSACCVCVCTHAKQHL